MFQAVASLFNLNQVLEHSKARIALWTDLLFNPEKEEREALTKPPNCIVVSPLLVLQCSSALQRHVSGRCSGCHEKAHGGTYGKSNSFVANQLGSWSLLQRASPHILTVLGSFNYSYMHKSRMQGGRQRMTICTELLKQFWPWLLKLIPRTFSEVVACLNPQHKQHDQRKMSDPQLLKITPEYYLLEVNYFNLYGYWFRKNNFKLQVIFSIQNWVVLSVFSCFDHLFLVLLGGPYRGWMTSRPPTLKLVEHEVKRWGRGQGG